MARFDHPNIVPVRDMGPTDAERPYYVMLLYPSSLAAECWRPTAARQQGAGARLLASTAQPQTLAVALRRLRAILTGLAEIHAAGIAHRDLKPRNILVDANGRAANVRDALSTRDRVRKPLKNSQRARISRLWFRLMPRVVPLLSA